jgi:mediator of RNA polymerase II transcription subunit 14
MNQRIEVEDGLHSSPKYLANREQSPGISEPTLEELERELPIVYDGQIPLGDLLSRVVQSVYAELSELVET